jgi:hypothetical protein
MALPIGNFPDGRERKCIAKLRKSSCAVSITEPTSPKYIKKRWNFTVFPIAASHQEFVPQLPITPANNCDTLLPGRRDRAVFSIGSGDARLTD